MICSSSSPGIPSLLAFLLLIMCCTVVDDIAPAGSPGAAAAPPSGVPARFTDALLHSLSESHSDHAVYQQFGYTLRPRDERSEELFREIEQAAPVDASYTTSIAGNVQQLDALAAKKAGGITAQQMARIIALAIDTAHQVSRAASEVWHRMSAWPPP